MSDLDLVMSIVARRQNARLVVRVRNLIFQGDRCFAEIHECRGDLVACYASGSGSSAAEAIADLAANFPQGRLLA